MSKMMFIMFAMLLSLLLMTAGCSDKNNNTTTATAECLTCHADDSNIRTIDGQWRNSIHASGNNIDRNVPPCSGCHTSDGFMERVTHGAPDTVPQPSVISCFTCHEPHTNKNFNLRIMTPVQLIQGGTFDHGVGNLCAQCHQARTPSPNLPAQGDSITIRSAFWGPHDGPQANVFAGLDAYVFPGASYSNSPHTTEVTAGCPTCHMATPFKNVAGGHQMSLTYSSFGQVTELTTGCNQSGCHTGLTDFNFHGKQDTVAALLTSLQDNLITDGLLAPDTSSISVNAPVTVNANQAGALYNFLLFHADHSLGVHNSQYTIDALNASIVALRPTLAWNR